MTEVIADAKENASVSFADVIRATAENFPEPAYQLERLQLGRVSERYAIGNLGNKLISGNSDGIGTKAELAERLFAATGDYSHFTNPAHDLVAMVADDAAREGHFVLGIQNNLDVNTASDPRFIEALAIGLRRACFAGKFALLSGETAELGTRTPGYGDHHLNWNASAVVLIHPEKMFHPENLKPGQPIVALRERSIRSNGLTRARAILEQAHISKRQYTFRREAIVEGIRQALAGKFSAADIDLILSSTAHQQRLWDQISLPWHEDFLELTQKLATPSTIYTPLIYEAQGGVDCDGRVPIVAAAHISGGGIPLKAKRLVERAGVGAHILPVFPDPEGIPELMDLAQRYPHPNKGVLVDDRSACEQWNRGIGFLCVTETQEHADQLIQLAKLNGYEATTAGQIIPQRKIEWRGHEWTY